MLISLLNNTELLKEAPVDFVLYIVFVAVTFLISLILHECAHGYMALLCGDPTAKMMGRLSLNPARHLDPLGTVFMLFAGVGWAKPVPVNPRNFRDFRRDDFLVSIAGIVTNLTLFLAACLLAVLVNLVLWNPAWLSVFDEVYAADATSAEFFVNIFDPKDNNVAQYLAYGVTFDWLRPFVNEPWLLYVQRFLLMMAQVNLGLACFNLLPIPPLDGFHLLNDTLLKGKLRLNPRVFQITHFVFIVLVWFTDVFDVLLSTVTGFIGGAVIRTFLMMTGQM